MERYGRQWNVTSPCDITCYGTMMGRFPRLTPVRLGLQVPDLYDGFSPAGEEGAVDDEVADAWIGCEEVEQEGHSDLVPRAVTYFRKWSELEGITSAA